MSATFNIYKYTGKDGTFGTPVTSIGIKRIDAAVPAVYQQMPNPGVVVPSDDKSDANTYCVYRPDDPDAIAYSFESVFKLVLKTPPSNQLSHIRIYPETEAPADLNIPTLYIGNSVSYTKPTNTVSMIATNSIWNYTKESPFLLTVNNNYGQYVDERLAVINYNISMHDIGTGNLIYLNEDRQIDVPIVQGSTYQFIDKTNGAIVFTILDPATNLPISSSDIVVTTVSGERVVTLTASSALLTAYPNGFKYGDVIKTEIGYTITWIDLSTTPATTEEYTVEVRETQAGTKAFYLNGTKSPVLNFLENRIYRFININGDTDPIRFLDNKDDVIANNEYHMVIYGITVENGGTVNEIVTIDPIAVKEAGYKILGYQSVRNTCYGNQVTNTRTGLVGNYNIKTVGAGINNPMSAGETDYVYLQLKVTGSSTVGQATPNIIIEYDES